MQRSVSKAETGICLRIHWSIKIRFALSKIDGEFAVRKTQGRIYVDAQSAFDFDETVEAPQEGVWYFRYLPGRLCRG